MKEEQILLNQVMEFLALKRILHVHVRNTGTIIHKDGRVIFGRQKYAGQQRGVPDILAWHEGKAYAFELKSKKGIVSQDQKEWLSRFRECCKFGFVVRSLEEVMAHFI